MAGADPIPITGIKNPSIAKLGIACTKFANPITILATFLFFVIKIPSGTPITTAIKTATMVTDCLKLKLNYFL